MCVVCDSGTDATVCADCADELDCPYDLIPEQILGAWNRASDGVLFDCWGRAFRLEVTTPIGRTLPRRGIAILHATVSRDHATIVREPNGDWFVIDHESTNTTRVNDDVVSRCVLAPGDRVSFGEISFYFQRDLGSVVEIDHDQVSMRTRPPIDQQEVDSVDTTEPTLPALRLRFVEAPSGGGGYLHLRGQQIRLSGTQFAMLLTLARRMTDECRVPSVVRGFVPSSQLIAELPWDASLPCEAHLKQLVRRTRKLLSSVDAELIESRRGFGYRLRAVPELVVDP